MAVDPEMVKKRTAEERRSYAEQNGFNDDDTDVDDNPTHATSWIILRENMTCKWSFGLSRLPSKHSSPYVTTGTCRVLSAGS